MLATRVPRYSQIAEALRERILGGALAPGTRLETQRRLARQFDVTLMTLRQALTVLEQEKLIARRHGLGTFVAAPSVDYDILQLRRLAQDLTALGEPVATRFVAGRFVRADRRVAEALALDGRGRAFVLERLRLLDRHPIGLQRSFLPAEVGEEVVKADPSVTPLHQILEFKLGLTIARAKETISTIRLGRPEARELGCRSGLPAFFSERTSYTADGAPVVFDRVFIPGDRFRITRELGWEGPSRNAEEPEGTARP